MAEAAGSLVLVRPPPIGLDEADIAPSGRDAAFVPRRRQGVLAAPWSRPQVGGQLVSRAVRPLGVMSVDL